MDKISYLKSIKDEVIKYRSSINLPKDLTFGIEIEYENIPFCKVSFDLTEEGLYKRWYKGWTNAREVDILEYSLDMDEMNGEVISPILKDTSSTWNNLKCTTNILQKSGGIVTERCGGHINIGAHILDNNYKNFRNFLLLWIAYKEEIYKFSSGEFDRVRPNQIGYIKPIYSILKSKLGEILTPSSVLTYIQSIDLALLDKSHELYLGKIKNGEFSSGNVIEIRVPNPTLREEIWQNYINFFSKLLLASKKDLDIEKLVYQIKTDSHDIFDFVDIVFDNQIDKTYFLIQSLKLNKLYSKELPKHKIYTKSSLYY